MMRGTHSLTSAFKPSGDGTAARNLRGAQPARFQPQASPQTGQIEEKGRTSVSLPACRRYS